MKKAIAILLAFAFMTPSSVVHAAAVGSGLSAVVAMADGRAPCHDAPDPAAQVHGDCATEQAAHCKCATASCAAAAVEAAPPDGCTRVEYVAAEFLTAPAASAYGLIPSPEPPPPRL